MGNRQCATRNHAAQGRFERSDYNAMASNSGGVYSGSFSLTQLTVVQINSSHKGTPYGNGSEQQVLRSFVREEGGLSLSGFSHPVLEVKSAFLCEYVSHLAPRPTSGESRVPRIQKDPDEALIQSDR